MVRDRIAQRLAASGRPVILAPTLPYTTAVLSRTYPGSVSVRAHNLVPFFTDVLNSLASNGLREIIVVSQHIDPPHVLAWEKACRQAEVDTGAHAIEGYERLLFDDLADEDSLSLILGTSNRGDSHAGLFETSIMMLARPDLVDLDSVKRLPPAYIEFDQLRRLRDFRQVADGLGYTGHPAKASADIGRRLVERYAALFGSLIEEHLAGVDVRDRLSVDGLFGK